MCDIIPEVESCCMCCSLRVGMLFISVLAIMTGSLSLTLIEKNSDFFHSALSTDVNVSAIPHIWTTDRSTLEYALWHFEFHNQKFYKKKGFSKEEMVEVAKDKVRLLIALLNVFCYLSMSWMIMGVVLFVSALKGEQCLVYVFTVGTFLLVIIGMLLAIPMTYTCLVRNTEPIGSGCMWDDDPCLVRHMDWLSGAATIFFYVMYLFGWFYFIIVANSYAKNGD